MCLGPLHKFFEEHGVVAESVQGLVAGLKKAFFQLLVVADDAHTAPAAAAGRFQHHGVADAVGLGFGGFEVDQVGFAALDWGHLALLGHFLGAHLIAEGFHHLGPGTDEN